MKTFKQVIVESTDSDKIAASFLKAKEIVRFIPGTKAPVRFTDALDKLAKAAQNKAIISAHLKDLQTYGIMRNVESAWRVLFDTKFRDVFDEAGVDTFDYWSMSSVADIKKLSKVTSKVKNNELDYFVDAIKELPEALKGMKSFVKTAKEVKEIEAAKDGSLKPKRMASVNGMKYAQDLMKSIVKVFEREYRKSVMDSFMDAFDKMKDTTEPESLPKFGVGAVIASMVFIKRGYGKFQTIELKEGASKIVERMATEQADNVIDGFVIKHTAKLAIIFEKKGEPKKKKINYTRVRSGVIENSMNFEFEDGSSFRIESQAISKVSKLGKWFNQYPTRFKNVIMADGTRMGMPSEAKMISDF